MEIDNNQNNERFNYSGLPNFWNTPFEVLNTLGDIPLIPADWLGEVGGNIYDTVGLLEQFAASRQNTNPEFYNSLDRHLTLSISLGHHLRSDQTVLQMDKEEFLFASNEAADILKIDDEQLVAYVRSLRNIPRDIPPFINTLNVALNQALEIYVLRLGIKIEDYPYLEYPVGHGGLAQFVSFQLNDRDLGLTILLHSTLTSPEVFKNATSESQTAVTNSDEAPKLPVKHLAEGLSSWVEHLRDDWEIETEDIMLATDEVFEGVQRTVNVKGWPRLSLNYDLVHNADVKMTMLVKMLTREFQRIQEGLNPAMFDSLFDDEENDSNNSMSRLFGVEYMLAEYKIIMSIMSDFVFGTQRQLESLTGVELSEPLGDLISDSRFLMELYNSDAVTLNEHGTVMGFTILTNFDNQTYYDKFGKSTDPLLDNLEGGVADVITPQQDYYIYVHPLIWKIVRMYLGSDLVA